MSFYQKAVIEETSPRYFIGQPPKDLKGGIESLPENIKTQFLAKELSKSGLRLGKNQKISELGVPESPLETPRSSEDSGTEEKVKNMKLQTSDLEGSGVESPSKTSTSSDESRKRGVTLDLPSDKDKTLIEGNLLFQVYGSKGWRKKLFVLNSKSLFSFSKWSAASNNVLRTENFTNIMLRASSDYAIELTVDKDVYVLLAPSPKESEDWAINLVKVAPPKLRQLLVLNTVNIFIPSLQAYQTVRTEDSSTVGFVKKIVVQKNPALDPFTLCLRRGDTARFLEDHESIQSPLLMFKSHFLEMRMKDSKDPKEESVPKPFDIDGYLNKQGAVGAIKGWKKRYFSTSNGNMFYSKQHPTDAEDDKLQDAIGLINLSNAATIDLEGSTNFEIKTTSRTYRLEAGSKEEAILWVVALRKIREHYRSLIFESWQKTSSIEVINPNEEKFVSCQKEGFLQKKGLFNKAFQARYFILTGGHLYYYTPSDAGQHFKGKISLANSHVTVVAVVDPEDENIFSVVTKERTYVLKAETQAEMEEWIRALNTERERIAA